MYAAVIVGLVVFLVPGGHCRPQTTALQGALEAVQFLTTSSIDKRQTTFPAYATCITNGLQDFLANYPQDCALAFSSVSNSSNIVSGGSGNQAIVAAYRLICQPRCGDPLIAYYNRCNAPRDVIDSFRYVCARNSAGRLCYELVGNLGTDLTRVSTNCNSQSSTNCTTGCQGALTTFGNNSGCCINGLNITSLNNVFRFTTFDYSVWSGCGVDTPGFCNLESSTLNSTEAPTTQSSTEAPTTPSSARVPKFVKALFLLTLIVMAMLLL